jgi:hypothetical protein
MSIGFLMGVNSTCGSRNDYGKLMGPNYGSFGLPLSVEEVDDQMNNSFVIINIIFFSKKKFVCENYNLCFKWVISILFMVLDCSYYLQGCNGDFFASRNWFG